MKKVKITSGRRQVSHRVQFQVSTSVHLKTNWLERELRERLVTSDHPLTGSTVEVAYIPDGHLGSGAYRITFTPEIVGSAHRVETLSIKQVMAMLEQIETDILGAVQVKHLLNGLEE